MAERLQSPPRASSSPSCFQTLFVHSQTLFSKRSRHCNFVNAIPSFGPLRSPKRRDWFRILSKSSPYSDSDSSSSDFGLISSSERSDGSFIFCFGNAKDKEAMVVKKVNESLVNERTKNGSEKAEARSKNQQKSNETQVTEEVKSSVDGISSSEKEVLSCSNSSVDEDVLSDALDGDFDEDIGGVCEDEVIIITSSELDPGSDISHNSDSLSSKDESNDTYVTSTSTEVDASEGLSLDEETNHFNAITSTETSIDEAMDRTLDGTETSVQLGHTESSTNEVKVEEIEDKMDIVEELPVPEALELHTIEETPNSEEISTVEFVLSSGASLLRHPTEGSTGGEDAYFVTCENWLGVADGIGQWSLEGISDGLYAQELLENCKRIVLDSDGIRVSDPSKVLVRTVAETESSGSSTILVAHFDGQALHVANVGDSGFVIIRDGSVFLRSSPIVHEFNFPLHVERGDDPSELIEAYKIDLNEGDVIVTATDGLFDNLYDREIASFVLESLEAGLKPQDIAESLCSRAQEVARSSSSRTPFSDAAQVAGYLGYSGGKLDNVVVIVSLVSKKEKRPSG